MKQKKNITVKKDIDSLLIANGQYGRVEPANISKVYVASSFGRYINIEKCEAHRPPTRYTNRSDNISRRHCSRQSI